METTAVTSIIVFLIGSGISVYVLTHYKLIIGTVKSWVGTALIALGFISLGFFCVSLPKVNGLILKVGENILQTVQVEKKLKETTLALEESVNALSEKKAQLDTLEAAISQNEKQIAPAAFNKVFAAIENAKTEGKESITENSGLIVMSSKWARTVFPKITWPQVHSNNAENEWVAVYGNLPPNTSKTSTGSVSAGFVIDPNTKQLQSMDLKPEELQTILKGVSNKQK